MKTLKRTLFLISATLALTLGSSFKAQADWGYGYPPPHHHHHHHHHGYNGWGRPYYGPPRVYLPAPPPVYYGPPRPAPWGGWHPPRPPAPPMYGRPGYY